MRVIWSWLAELVDVSGVTPSELAERWTLAGLEVTAIETIGDWWDTERILVGQVVRVERHPNADRLVLVDVNLGAGGVKRVVTGAPNLLHLRDAGDLPQPLQVAYAAEGSELYDGHAAGWEKTTLKGREVRGVWSDAMVCSEKELGLSEDHEGILILDTPAPAGSPLKHVLGDTVLEIDILPSFARVMNMVGVARETAVLLGGTFTPPPVTVLNGANGSTAGGAAAGPLGSSAAADCVDVEIQDPDLCARYTARVIDGLASAPSPFLVARRLTLAGMRPINNLVDTTNYVMLEWGEPLHAFDYDRLRERAGSGKPVITVRRARPSERMRTLDGVERELDHETLLITDSAGPLAIAGVMGGAETELGPNTRTVLLEAATFDPISIRRTARAQRLASESAARFGRGVPASLADLASRRASAMLAELGGGTVLSGSVDAYPITQHSPVIRFHTGQIERVLGMSIPVNDATDILARLEFVVEREEEDVLRVHVPDHRLDVALEADLIEELVRVYGYDRLPAALPADPLPPQRTDRARASIERARDALVAAGLQEAITYRLVDPATDDSASADAAPLSGDGRGADGAPGSPAVPDANGTPGPSGHIRLANPTSPERSALRKSLPASLLEVTRSNLRHRDRVQVFEIGPVFIPAGEVGRERAGERLPIESWRIGIVLAGPARDASWREPAGPPVDFYHIKGVVDGLTASLGVGADWHPGTDHPSLHPTRSATLKSGDHVIGHAGELHPLVAEKWSLDSHSIALAELVLDELVSARSGPSTFRPFSSFPPVKEDLAVIVAETVTAADVGRVIASAGGDLVARAQLFDVYRGRQVGAGNKSLAWSLVLQAPDRTLTDDEAARVRARIVDALKRDLGAELRT